MNYKKVIFDGVEAIQYEGPTKTEWDFDIDLPWISPGSHYGSNGMDIVVQYAKPDFNAGDWDTISVGLPFLELIKRFNEIFIEDEDPEEALSCRKSVIYNLKKAIELLEIE